jgi:hypothetical protein
LRNNRRTIWARNTGSAEEEGSSNCGFEPPFLGSSTIRFQKVVTPYKSSPAGVEKFGWIQLLLDLLDLLQPTSITIQEKVNAAEKLDTLCEVMDEKHCVFSGIPRVISTTW